MVRSTEIIILKNSGESLFTADKERTIRKAMGGGGEFSSCKNFFSL